MAADYSLYVLRLRLQVNEEACAIIPTLPGAVDVPVKRRRR
jgi:hypothetical protein